MGADKSIDQALSYSRIMTPALIFLLFTEGAYAIFRSEGNAKLVMIISFIGQILHLGIPVSIGQILMAVVIFTTIKVIAQVSGENGVAVYSTGLRYMHFLVLPLIGISSSVVTVVGAAYGARNRKKMLVAFNYALKMWVLVSGIMLAVTFLAAPLITKMLPGQRAGIY